MKEKEDVLSHIKDLWQMAEERGYATTSAFLSEEERAKFLQSIKGERGASYFLLPENGERQLFVFYPSFMTEEECRSSLSGENAPFSILEIRGKQKKFAEKLSHRDVLGAVMNLGISREQVGDILFQEDVSYLFLLRKMKDYVAENLSTIRHTAVQCKEVVETEGMERREVEERIFVPSERLDAVVSAVFHLSRGNAQEYFQKEFVYRDGITVKGSSSLKGGEKISVRGLGKFRYIGVEKNTKKGRIVAVILRYI